MGALQQNLIAQVAEESTVPNGKITTAVVQVGMACASSFLGKPLAHALALVDV